MDGILHSNRFIYFALERAAEARLKILTSMCFKWLCRLSAAPPLTVYTPMKIQQIHPATMQS